MENEKTLDDFISVFERHIDEDKKNFARISDELSNVQKEIDMSEMRIGAQLDTKVDKPVFAMFMTFAIPVFGWAVWYTIQTGQHFTEVQEKYGEIQQLNTINIEKTATDVTWIKNKLNGYDVILK